MALAAVLAAGAAPAAEWTLTPEVRETILFDDNRRLTLADHASVWGNELWVGGKAGYATERTEVELRPRFRQRRFSNEKDLLDRDDFLFDGTFSRSGERSLLEVELGLEYRGSITTDLESTVRNNVNVDARDRSLAATWSYALDPKNTVQVGGSYSDISYEAGATSGLSDYRFSSISATGIHQLTERDQLSLSVFESRFTQPRATTVLNGVSTTRESETDTLGFQLGYSRSFTENLLASASVGKRFSDSESEVSQDGLVAAIPIGAPLPAGGQIVGISFPFFLVQLPTQTTATDGSSSGLALTASVEQQLETLDWSLDYTRSLTPQSDGDLTERDDLKFGLDKRFTERLIGTLDARYFQDSGLDGGGQQERELLRLAVGARWRLTRFWSVNGRVQYRRNEGANNDAAESNAIFLTLAYNGDKLSWSR